MFMEQHSIHSISIKFNDKINILRQNKLITIVVMNIFRNNI